jgi:hypothetical protein
VIIYTHRPDKVAEVWGPLTKGQQMCQSSVLVSIEGTFRKGAHLVAAIGDPIGKKALLSALKVKRFQPDFIIFFAHFFHQLRKCHKIQRELQI